MSRRRLFQLSSVRAVLIAILPLACAHSVEQDFADDDDQDTGMGSGGSLIVSEAGMPGTSGKATSAGSGGGASNPFGGSTNTGGKAGAGSGGADTSDAGAASGGKAGSSAGGASGSGSGGASGA